MRNRILAGVGIAALATVGVAAPAAADNHTSDVYVVHGILGVPVDVYLADTEEPLIGGFNPLDVTEEPLALEPGDYDLVLVAQGGELGTDDVYAQTVTVPEAGLNITVVAHATTEGAPVLTGFVNNMSQTAAGEARLSVRHTANVGAVDVLANGEPLADFVGVENPTGADIDVPADTYAAAVAPTGTTEPAIGPADLDLAEGVNTLVYAVSDLEGTEFNFAVQTLEVGAAAVDGIPAGGAGLVAENNNGGLIAAGVALLVALLAAAGIIARREAVSSK